MFAKIAVAKSVCRTRNRFNQKRMPATRHYSQRTASEANPLFLLRVLSSFEDSFVLGSQRACSTRSRTPRAWKGRRNSDGRRAASALSPSSVTLSLLRRGFIFYESGSRRFQFLRTFRSDYAQYPDHNRVLESRVHGFQRFDAIKLGLDSIYGRDSLRFT